MKKLSYLTLALVLSVMVACSSKEKKQKGGDEDSMDMTMQVDPNASQQMSNAETTATDEMTVDEEVFGTDLDDSKADKAIDK